MDRRTATLDLAAPCARCKRPLSAFPAGKPLPNVRRLLRCVSIPGAMPVNIQMDLPLPR